MHSQQRQRTRDLLHKRGIERALFAHPESITWLTGFAPLPDLGVAAFSGGPALLWYEDEHFTLLIQDGYVQFASGLNDEPDCTLLVYEGYTIQRPIQAVDNLNALLKRVVGRTHSRGSLGVEVASLSAAQQNTLHEALDIEHTYRLDGWLKPLRMIKTDEEIVKLRRSFELADIGFAAAKKAAIIGAQEIEIWMAFQSAISIAAGARCVVGNDCTVGYRQNNIGSLPLNHALREGDSLIVDISAVHNGYWSDGCRTFYATEPTADQIKRHRFINDALDYAISLIRPGIKANMIDASVRAFIERGGYPVYPHHTGHGVGVGPHEEPRIVPYNETVLEPGMVIMLEPGTYVPGETGCRLEDGLLITNDGVEILTQFDRGVP